MLILMKEDFSHRGTTVDVDAHRTHFAFNEVIVGFVDSILIYDAVSFMKERFGGFKDAFSQGGGVKIPP